MNILLIDDDRFFSGEIISFLHGNGHRISYIYDMCSVFKQSFDGFDIIILDMMLPPSFTFEGLEVLRHIKSLNISLPVIMISQKDDHMTSIVTQAYELGVSSFLDKNLPSFFIDLQKIIERIRKKMNDRVFISHGHNELLLYKLKDFIQNSLGKEPVVLSEQPNSGLTIVEKLEQAAEKCSKAIILLTKDDETASGEKRARQNVIHELGFFQGRYGRKNVILLLEHGVESFSNISGIVYYSFDDSKHFETVYENLRNELK